MRQLLISFSLLFALSIVSCSDSGTGTSPDPDNGNGGETVNSTYEVNISVAPSDAGTISPSADDTYDEGEEIELQADANEGYLFSSWTGDIESSENPLSLTIDQDYSLTANFEVKSYELIVNTSGEGTVSEQIVQEKSKDYEHGTVVELTANPSEGWKFIEWQGDITSTDNPSQITIDNPREVTAIFEKKSYELTLNVTGEGSITKDPDQSEYEHGNTVELTATPAEGWEFVEWQGDMTGTDNPAQIIFNSAQNITAFFEESRTKLEGIISTNTTLTSSESPYQLTGKVQVAYGTTLKIEQGVRIYGDEKANNDQNTIEIFGDLLIEGTSNSQVSLENVTISPGYNTPDELFNIEIHYLNMIGGELYSPSGNAIYGSITLKNSFLYRVNRMGFSDTYMYIWYPVEDCYIENNVFYNTGRIDTGHSSANVYIRNNFFFRDQGLSNETGYAVENWLSGGSDSKTILKNNTFASTEGIAVSLPSGYDGASLDATENYWSSTSEEDIQNMIFDKNDDLSVAEIIPYDPYLESPSNDTPSLPDSLK